MPGRTGVKKPCQIIMDLNITYHDANKDRGDILRIQPHTCWLQILKPLLSQCFFYSGTLAARTEGCHVRINLLSSRCWMERGQLGSLLKAFPRWLSSLSFPTQDAQTPGGGRNNFSSTRIIRGAAAREMNFGTDISRKVRSSAHTRNEEAAAGEAAG